MTNLFQQKWQQLRQIGEQLVDEQKLPAELLTHWDRLPIVVEPPRDPNHGDLSSNFALLLAKPLGLPPRKIAEPFWAKMEEQAEFETVTLAGPGFLNWRHPIKDWQKLISTILEQGLTYGNSQLGAGIYVNVEYVSANPTGPLHVGHSRGAVVGDALAGLMEKAGYQVTREFYVNDAGAQIDKLAHSVYMRYLQALGQAPNPLPELGYPGDYLVQVGQALADEFGDAFVIMPEEAWLQRLRPFCVEAMLDLIKEDLALVGIHHDRFSSEKELVEQGKIETMLKVLEDQNLLYHGILEPPKGKPPPEDWEPRTQLLFRSTEFGDDVDRPLQKSDGSWTYFASDIAYHYDKFLRGGKVQIDVLGADHSGYVKRIQAALRAVTQEQASHNAKICQIVKFIEDGQPMKMSKRAGTFVTLRDLIDAVGKDVIRFYMLMRKNDAPLDFDLTLVRQQSRDNPVFYVQYAHARCASVLRQAERLYGHEMTQPEALIKVNFKTITHPFELSLIKMLAQWPRIVEAAAQTQEPHRVVYYLNDLAGCFHSLWTRGKEETQLRFLDEQDRAGTLARLGLVLATKSVLANGLHVVGVEPMDNL